MGVQGHNAGLHHLHHQLLDALSQHHERITRLFTEWDTDQNGLISQRELMKAVQSFGLAEDDNARDAVKVGCEALRHLLAHDGATF